MSSYTPLSQQRDNAKSVIRLRNCMPEKFFSFCLMHLSIILDLNDNSLEEILTDAKPRRAMTPLWRKKGKSLHIVTLHKRLLNEAFTILYIFSWGLDGVSLRLGWGRDVVSLFFLHVG